MTVGTGYVVLYVIIMAVVHSVKGFMSFFRPVLRSLIRDFFDTAVAVRGGGAGPVRATNRMLYRSGETHCSADPLEDTGS